MWRRSGWFGARAADGSQALFFLYTWRQRTRFLEFGTYAVPGGAASCGRPLLHVIPVDFTPRVQPLSALDGMWAGQDVKVFELRLQGEASDTAISIWESHPRQSTTRAVPCHQPPLCFMSWWLTSCGIEGSGVEQLKRLRSETLKAK